jgi:hypothetical protein
MNVGLNSLGISGPDSYSDESLIPIGSSTAAAIAAYRSEQTTADTKASARKLLPRLSKSSGSEHP